MQSWYERTLRVTCADAFRVVAAVCGIGAKRAGGPGTTNMATRTSAGFCLRIFQRFIFGCPFFLWLTPLAFFMVAEQVRAAAGSSAGQTASTLPANIFPVSRSASPRPAMIIPEPANPDQPLRLINGGPMANVAWVNAATFSATNGVDSPPPTPSSWHVVAHVLEDDFERLWISCNRGIYRVERAALNAVAEGWTNRIGCVVYGEADGMAGAETNGENQPAGLKASDGRLYFATAKDVVVIDPKFLRQDASAPSVLIEQVVVDGETVVGDGQPTSSSTRIRLEPGRGAFAENPLHRHRSFGSGASPFRVSA